MNELLVCYVGSNMAFVQTAGAWFIVVVLLAHSSSVNGLQCFECSASDGQSCVDPETSSKSLVTDCSKSLFTLSLDSSGTNEAGYMCMKTIEQNSTTTVYTRRCALSSEVDFCNHTTYNSSFSYNNLTLVKCYLCQTDYCNHSSIALCNIYLILLFILLRYLL